MSTVCIVLAGGSGTRMDSTKKKQFIRIEEKEIIYYTLDSFENNEQIDEIVLVVGKDDDASSIKRIYSKITSVVVGGETRQHSVYNALKVLKKDCDIVLVHDGVRPFADKSLIQRVIEQGKQTGACIPVVKSNDTIKRLDSLGVVQETPKRNFLVCAQTPQCFKASILKRAHEKAFEQNYIGTDDSELVERIGVEVATCSGSEWNIKITTPIDLIVASAILRDKL